MTEIQMGDVVMFTPQEPSLSEIWRQREKRSFLVIATNVNTFGTRPHELYDPARDDFFYAEAGNLTLVSAANHSPTILSLIAPNKEE